MPAVRNVRMCTKDCLCLYVCPTGATDTENSVIDVAKCLAGCRACVDACPSGAIFLRPDSYPPQQMKRDEVVEDLRRLARSKALQARIASDLAASTEDGAVRQLTEALARSNALMAEDLMREAGFMLPQSEEVRDLLSRLVENPSTDFPADAAKELLSRLERTHRET